MDENPTVNDDIQVPDENPTVNDDIQVPDEKLIDQSAEGSGDAPEEEAPPDLSAPENTPPVQVPTTATAEQVTLYDETSVNYKRLTELKAGIELELKQAQEVMSQLAPIVIPPVDRQENQRGIIRYIEGQKTIRAEKAAKITTVLQGLKLNDILPHKGSKLDAAMARKLGFGLKRPTYGKPAPA